ncbi:MAG TPA: HAD-IG family 5'-nucleotidase [Planctomycetota bacterium]|nr:HAD-IG family 5'-nucleotidase [Planctomycetota bacterium]
MGTTRPDFEPAPERRVFCNRTLNMRSIRAVGFDMDYTLVHYDVRAWEERAYAHVQLRLLERGLPVRDLSFDRDLFARGLIVDLALGNIVKANRFGYVTQAAHGTQLLSHETQRHAYSQVWVDLGEERWVFLNTLFSLSEACLYGQLVDLFDRGELGVGSNGLDYKSLYTLVSAAMDAAHLEGELKAEIIAAPERFVDLDPLLPQTLLDLAHAGKKLFLATNSEWHYTHAMMGYVFDAFFAAKTDGVRRWQDLFDLVIVQARKPAFFDQSAPFAEVIDDAGTGRPLQGPLRRGVVYRGGNAQAVQEHFHLDGSEILYVGDHVYADVHVSSQIRRWRTALVLRELEHEVLEEQQFAAGQAELEALMRQKERLDHEQATLRLALLRLEHGDALPAGVPGAAPAIQERLRALRQEIDALDQRVVPLAKHSGQLGHVRWGSSMRAGNDKSRLARQIEGHADVYTSRVSNLMALSPFGYLRAARGSLPHDAAGR